MAHDWFSIDKRDAYFHLSNGSSPTLVIRDRRPPPRSPRPASGNSKSSNATNRIASSSSPSAGSSNVPLPGSVDTDGSCATSSATRAPALRRRAMTHHAPALNQATGRSPPASAQMLSALRVPVLLHEGSVWNGKRSH